MLLVLFLLVLIVSFYFWSIKGMKSEFQVEVSEEIQPIEMPMEVIIDSSFLAEPPPIALQDYKVILAVDENLKLNETGELRVRIGGKGMNVSFSQGMVQDESTIPASIGQYAKITPFAPDFEVSPTEKACVKIHPSGSEVLFSIKPKKTGSLKVSASIELFDNVDCTGASVPKTAATLSVHVVVDKKQRFHKRLQELWAVVWSGFLSFWGALITLLFAVLLFLIRRKLKRKTGYDDKKG